MHIDRLRDILAMDPEDPLANFALGHKLVMEYDGAAEHAEAVPFLRKAVAGNPEHLAAYYALALALQTGGEDEAAKDICTAALAILPRVPHGSGEDLLPNFEMLLDDLDV